ncbi:MAG TPA: cytochrome P450 [Acidimicrobiia bacterium]|nr:cytochrome P450 [Acidimicrobiia bacterium]
MYTEETPAHGGNGEMHLMDKVFSPACADMPHDVYAELLAQCPVSRQTGMFGNDVVMLSRYEDVLWALKHPEVFSSKGVVDIGGEFPLIPLSVDPPEHAKYRRLLDPEFSPRKMAELEDEMRRFVNEAIDAFIDHGECDFHEDFASPLPSTFFLALTGLPHADLPKFLKWRDDTIRPEAPTFEEGERIRKEAGDAIENYFESALEEKRRNPDDRLFTRMVRGTVDGRPLTRAEMLGACHLLLLGGLDTVTATLDCMIVYLARHPERRDALVADPSCIPHAVEELLRHQTPVMMVPRVLTRDHEMRGVQMKAGDSVTLMIGAANADAAEFEEWGDVRFDRTTNRHLAFGGGPHRCLGSHLARLELRVALEEFHRRIPEYRLAQDEIHFSPGIRQADQLPLVFPVTQEG